MLQDDFQLKEQIKKNMQRYLEEKGINPRKKFHCLNPAHPDLHPSMSFDARTNTVHCFSCGITYDLFSLIGAERQTESFAEQYRMASDFCHLSASHSSYLRCLPTSASGLTEEIIASFSQSGDRSYLYRRGLDDAVVERHKIFVKEGRAYLPVWQEDTCISYCARAVDDQAEPKYLNTKGEMGIFNLDILKDARTATVFICEGIFDALCLEQLGYDAIALCGAGNGGKLLRLLDNGEERWRDALFILAGDHDAAGEQMNQTLKERLESMGIASVVLPFDPDSKDVNQAFLADPDRLEQDISAAMQSREKLYTACCAADALEQLEYYIIQTAREPLSTGFSALDNLLGGGLFDGLYVLGAVSSLGKTSLILQVADALAKQKYDVLFFTLEMGRYELLSRSLSRLSYRLDDTTAKTLAFTSREILSGADYEQYAKINGKLPLLSCARQVYGAESASHLFFREGDGQTSVGRIWDGVQEHIAHRKTRPVVIVDYLQILKESGGHASDKQNMDRIVSELKRMSREFSIPVLAISSLNRESYRMPIAMEAFKESGSVEYSADVLMGLQFAGIGKPGFDANVQKNRTPREVELVILKNRNGVSYAKLPMRYYAKYNYFEQTVFQDAVGSGRKK